MSIIPHFELSSETRDGSTHLIHVKGEIHVSTAPEFAARLDEAIAGDDSAVVLDLTEVEFIDSTGLTVLLNGPAQRDAPRRDARAGDLEPDGAAALRDHAPRHDVRHRADRGRRAAAREGA